MSQAPEAGLVSAFKISLHLLVDRRGVIVRAEAEGRSARLGRCSR